MVLFAAMLSIAKMLLGAMQSALVRSLKSSGHKPMLVGKVDSAETATDPDFHVPPANIVNMSVLSWRVSGKDPEQENPKNPTAKLSRLHSARQSYSMLHFLLTSSKRMHSCKAHLCCCVSDPKLSFAIFAAGLMYPC